MDRSEGSSVRAMGLGVPQNVRSLIGGGATHGAMVPRVRVWNMSRSCCRMPAEILCHIASFAPLAGARLLLTCRGGVCVCDRFLDSFVSESELWYVYLQTLQYLLSTCPRLTMGVGRCSSQADGLVGRGHLHHDTTAEATVLFVGDLGARQLGVEFKAAVAQGITLGADADLVFVLALMFTAYKSEFESRACGRGFCLGDVGEELLYAACGPRSNDAVVSVLLGLGAPVDDLRPLVGCRTGKREETPLVRAVSWGKESTVRTLLRRGAVPDMIVGFATLCYCGCERKATALYIAVRARRRGIVEALLEHGACPSSVCRIARRCTRCDPVGSLAVGCGYRFIQRSAWQLDDYEDRLFVLHALMSCERRCRCHVCSGESPEHLEALRCEWTLRWERVSGQIYYDVERDQLLPFEPACSHEGCIESNSARRLTVLARERVECNRARAVQLRAARRARLGESVGP